MTLTDWSRHKVIGVVEVSKIWIKEGRLDVPDLVGYGPYSQNGPDGVTAVEKKP
jgi:hypothetical protein